MLFDPFGFFAMNSPTCQALTALFPLILITVVLERREMAVPLRRRPWFRQGQMVVITGSVIGLCIAIAGCQSNGLNGFSAFIGWLAVGVSVAGLALTVLASTASVEVEEDAPVGGPSDSNSPESEAHG